MPGCTAPYCKNSSEQGFFLTTLPKDEKLRAVWINNINRRYQVKDWVPTKNSRLCEVHFAAEMWENKRMDKLQKLKRFAVPTIFGYYITKKTFVQRACKSTQTLNDTFELPVITTSVSKCDQSTSTDTDSNLKKLTTLKRHYSVLRTRLKSLQIKNQVLLKVLGTDKYRAAMYKIFNEDQIQSLISDKTSQKWSHDTIRRALKLRSICGTNGYEEIRQQGIPLPCLRTLQRSQLKIDLQLDISKPTWESSEQLLSILNADWK